jgi:hypothetical protein
MLINVVNPFPHEYPKWRNIAYGSNPKCILFFNVSGLKLTLDIISKYISLT